MTEQELLEKLEQIQRMKCETSTLELKSAEKGCPKRLYDTLSSFSNQDDGGIIIFGVNEEQGYLEVGVYDPQDIQKCITEQCLQMEPVVRPLLTVVEKNEKYFVSAEIPGVDITERPVFYRGSGKSKGSYTRVGDSDQPMTEYEIYSYEAYRRKYQDDIRTVERATMQALDQGMLERYLQLLKEKKPRLGALSDNEIYELMSIKRNDQITISSVMNFSPYPQAYFPQLCIIATVVPGNEVGVVGNMGERFIDNQRIEGSIPEMVDSAVQFVSRNMKTSTIIDAISGARDDRTDYPVVAVREAILNALVHRDYSIHTEGMPIQLVMFDERLEITSPGGVYGRIKIDQLGKVQPDTRNPVIAFELETLQVTENRYSGIPTIRRLMKEHGLPEPEFLDERGCFIVKMYKKKDGDQAQGNAGLENGLIAFCKTPRTRSEISQYLGLSSITYAIQTYVMPLVEQGKIRMTIPQTPKSPKQQFYSE